MRRGTRSIIGFALLVAVGPCVAAEEKPGSFDGEIVIGYRSVSTEGSENKYREDINLEDGPLLFNFDMRLVPEGDLRGFADEIYVDLENLGSQPYEVMRIGVRKAHRYDFRWDRTESVYFYDNVLAAADGSPAVDPRNWNFRRVRDLGQLAMNLTKRATLTFGYEQMRRNGQHTDTPHLRRDVFQANRVIDDSLRSFRGAFSYAWDKLTMTVEARHKEYDNPIEYFVPGQQVGPSETLDFLVYDIPYSYDADEYALRLVARPTKKLNIRFAAELQDLDLDTTITEQWTGLDNGGAPVQRDESGVGRVEREIGLFDLDLTYMVTTRIAILFGVRHHALDQDGRSMFDGDDNIGLWDIVTTGAEVGAQFVVTRSVTVTAGVMFEQRDAESASADNPSTPDIDRTTDNAAIFASAVWRPSKKIELSGEIDHNAIDDPFTMASPTDRRRIRVRGRYRWDSGLWLMASYNINDFENENSGWTSDHARADARIGFSNRKIDFSAGYANVDAESAIGRLLNDSVPFPVFYTADSDFVDGRVRWNATRALALIGSVYHYENTGTVGIERRDYRGGFEYTFQRSYLVGAGYRSVDYEDRNVALNDYDTEIIDFTVGYRW